MKSKIGIIYALLLSGFGNFQLKLFLSNVEVNYHFFGSKEKRQKDTRFDQHYH